LDLSVPEAVCCHQLKAGICTGLPLTAALIPKSLAEISKLKPNIIQQLFSLPF